jgi:hypothetical protein
MIGAMLVSLVGCPVCADAKMDQGANGDEVGRAAEDAMRGVRITTEMAQLLGCSQGHEFLIHFQDGGYAMLYERALERLVEGRTRDAVLDAYTAFDMFLGWFVLAAAFEKRYPPPIPLEEAPLGPLREDMKDVLKTAERTTGAALALAAIATGTEPPRIDPDLNKLRNKAVHVGAYPSDEDANWACLQIEELVCTLRERLTLTPIEGGMFSRFTMALLIDSRRRALGNKPFPSHNVTHALMTVLASDVPPRTRKAVDRIAEYQRGERWFFID